MATKTPFSRFLALPTAPGRQIVEKKLRVLVAIADPTNFADYPELASIDRAAETAALKTPTLDLPVEWTVLPAPCSLVAIQAALRQGQGYHVLHFVGHGTYNKKRGAALYLANDLNRVRITRADRVAEIFSQQAGSDSPLQLVFLGSCQTASISPADAFRGLAPQLFRAGIPVVVAMQDWVSVDTVRAFAATFYCQLLQHGVVDLAANEARASLMTAGLPGAAIPVIFMRLRDGRLLIRPATLAGSQAPGAPMDKTGAPRKQITGPRVLPRLPYDPKLGFLDREPQTEELQRYLKQDASGLINIVGPDGMGKTALASKVLSNSSQIEASDFDDPEPLAVNTVICLRSDYGRVSLGDIYENACKALGKTVGGKLMKVWKDTEYWTLNDKIEQLLDALQDGGYVFLLDGVKGDFLSVDEELWMFVERCLIQGIGVRFITTSQEIVSLPAGVPGRHHEVSLLDGLPQKEAVAFLRHLDDGSLKLHEIPEDVLERAVVLIKGIPLALRLLATHIKEHQLDILLEDLLANPDLLASEIVDKLVGSTYRLIEEPDRRVTEALAVFDQPVPERAISYLLQSYQWDFNLDVRASLQRLSMRYIVSYSGRGGAATYGLHSLYGIHIRRLIPKPQDQDRATVYNRRNLELHAAEYFAENSKPPNEWKNLDDLKPKLAEFEHRVRGEDYYGAARLFVMSDTDWFRLGYAQDVANRLDEVLDEIKHEYMKTLALIALGAAYDVLGKHESARQRFTRALDLWQDNMSATTRARALAGIGTSYYGLERLDEAKHYLQLALTTASDAHDRMTQAVWLNNLGNCHEQSGEIQLAIECLNKAHEISTQEGDDEMVIKCLGNLGNCYVSLGKYEAALLKYEQAIPLAQSLPDRAAEATFRHSIAEALIDNGQYEAGIENAEAGARIGQDIGQPRTVGENECALARAHLFLNHLPVARSAAEKALEYPAPHNNHYAQTLLGLVQLRAGDHAAARLPSQERLPKPSGSWSATMPSTTLRNRDG